MKTRTLRARLLIAAVLWIAVAWPLGTAALYFTFEEAVTERFDAKLRALLTTLVEKVRIDPETGAPMVVGPVNPAFADPAANWHWIVDYGGQRLASSAPAEKLDLSVAAPVEPRSMAITAEHTVQGPARAATIRFAPPGTDLPVTATVVVDSTDIAAELRTFASLLTLSIVLLGLGLVLPVFLQVRYGLAPLRQLTADLAQVRTGMLERLPGQYPSDIDPIRRSINEVLEHDRMIVERARKSAGNLAHALKTELARLEAGDPPNYAREQVLEATGRIARIVDHHLARASASVASRPGLSADAGAVIVEVTDALSRVYGHRGVRVETDLPVLPPVAVETQDLEEIIGNLVENACEHAETRVHVEGRALAGQIRIMVSDDGAGLDASGRDLAVRRGVRLDERGPGAGLGLSIVADLVGLYSGRLDLQDSALGGLEANVILPAAEIANSNTGWSSKKS